MGSRSFTPNRILDFVRFAEGAIVVERALHDKFFKIFDIQPVKQKSPACFTYTNFLLASASHGSYEEAVAALLPCFWIYGEVGKYIYQTATPNNPYQEWIDTYAGEKFNELVNKAIIITEETAARTTEEIKMRMAEAFIASSRLEWMFWDSAYRLEAWKP